MTLNYCESLLKNVHKGLPLPDSKGETFFVKGDYDYWHYGCDGFNDKGWGCGYRTLQTICSWMQINKNPDQAVPSLRTIQETLVALEDKEPSFIGSREWIGSFEICLVLDKLHNVLSKIVHVHSGKDLVKNVDVIKKHFEEMGPPVMMGGDRDCSSKGIMGIHIGKGGKYLLVVDPHFTGKAKSIEQLQSQNWIKWQNLDDFIDSSFYNLCLPQAKFIKRDEDVLYKIK
ncbi:ufm1-specific protease 1 [Belonocnema kinseyi]|uniref:ufm1-specific protease 1 n=1 Tax=Belonocnema kinseyi TaxID=2817044 RepID=UPI00143DD6A4|nr:ufm1-specific protease 1 [Belonocnema kinseyi]